MSSLQATITGNYTIEFWFYPTQQRSGSGNYQTIFDTQGSTSTVGFFLNFENNFTCQSYIGNNSTGYRNVIQGSAGQASQFLWTQNAWNHYALVYTTTNGYTLYLNGFCHGIDNSTTAVTLANWCTTWQIGCRKNSGSPDLGINQGYLQHFRVSNIARYTGFTPRVSTYTVPTGAFTPDANTVYLNSFDQSSGSTIGPSQLTPSISTTFGYINLNPNASITTPNNIHINSAIGTIGYTTGSGGAVTQASNKSTGVTLNTATGNITMNNASLGASTIVSFTLTNSLITANDLLLVSHVSAGTLGAYTCTASCSAGSAIIYVRNSTGGALSEAIVLKYTIIEGSIS